MIYAKDTTGKLRAFTLGNGETDVEQVSTFEKARAVKMTVLQEAGLKLKGAVLCLIQGGVK